MTEISILAIDLAKHNFQVCATTSEGEVIYNRKYTRGRLAKLLAAQDPCVVAMEACGTSNYWGRLAISRGHDAKIIPPIYVKPFVRRGAKNDAMTRSPSRLLFASLACGLFRSKRLRNSPMPCCSAPTKPLCASARN